MKFTSEKSTINNNIKLYTLISKVTIVFHLRSYSASHHVQPVPDEHMQTGAAK